MTRRTSQSRSRSGQRLEYWLLYSVTFLVFLVVALAVRLLPRRLDPLDTPSGPRRSVLAEARSAASTTTGYAFMG